MTNRICEKNCPDFKGMEILHKEQCSCSCHTPPQEIKTGVIGEFTGHVLGAEMGSKPQEEPWVAEVEEYIKNNIEDTQFTRQWIRAHLNKILPIVIQKTLEADRERREKEIVAGIKGIEDESYPRLLRGESLSVMDEYRNSVLREIRYKITNKEI